MKRTIELLEIEGILFDDRLNDRTATLCTGQCKPFGTVLDAATVATASQTFYRVGRPRSEAGSALVH